MQLKTLFDAIAVTYDKSLHRTGAWEFGKKIVKRAEVKKGDLVLVVGCGTGRETYPSEKLGANVISLDLSKKMIEVLRNRMKRSECLVADATYLPFRGSVFDKVVSNEVWILISTEEKRFSHVAEMGRVLKKHGTIFIGGIRNRLAFFVANMYRDLVDDLGNRREAYYHNFSPWEIKRLVHDAGLKIIWVQKSVSRNWRSIPLLRRLYPMYCNSLLDIKCKKQ